MERSERAPEGPDPLRSAESALRKLGYSRIRPRESGGGVDATFWVQESGVPRRTFPVFVAAAARQRSPDWVADWDRSPVTNERDRRAIVVVPSDDDAEEAWRRLSRDRRPGIDAELSILVVPAEERAGEGPHWHARTVDRAEILRLATGIVVGMFRRAQASQGSSQVDFEEMLGTMRTRFGIDVHRSLGVRSNEDALYLIYQMAMRDSYAPGDPGANLHMLVLKPTGPGARLPWFAG